ncbi:MAG: pseudouridine synthase, partial [Cytophagales bacterium]
MRNSRNNSRNAGKSFGSRSSQGRSFDKKPNTTSSNNKSDSVKGDRQWSKPKENTRFEFKKRDSGSFGQKKSWNKDSSDSRFEKKNDERSSFSEERHKRTGGFSRNNSGTSAGSSFQRKNTGFSKTRTGGFVPKNRLDEIRSQKNERSDNELKPRKFSDNKGARKFEKSDRSKRNFIEERPKTFDKARNSSSFDRNKDKAFKSEGLNQTRFKDSDPQEKSHYAGKGKRVLRRRDDVSSTPTYSKSFKTRTKSNPTDSEDGMRLNRYIANSGVCSRREADFLIKLGEVTVNGNIVTEMGYKVKPGDVVKYSGRTLKPEKMVYVLLNKPKDYITTTNDPENRRTVMDLVANAAKERLFPVGRLDRNTTGLLLLTNDGELADKLSHPSNRMRKIYEVTLDKPLEEKDFERIVKGVHLDDGKADVNEIAIVSPDRRVVGLEIHIGRNRIVRRIFEYLGYEVEKLDRVMYANLTKKDLPRGHWRYL